MNFDFLLSNFRIVWNWETHLGNAEIVNDRGGKNEKKITMLENKMNVSINEIAKVLKNGSQPNGKPSIYIIPQI